MSQPRPAAPARPTTVVIDYQNIHLVAAEVFLPTGTPPHLALLDPYRFATTLIDHRNTELLAHAPHEQRATLREVIVYRGLPSAEFAATENARNQKQQAQWEQHKEVTVHHRPLRYEVRNTSYQVDYQGEHHHTREGRTPREKGIDVLCALATARHAATTGHLVILASHDSDLEPAVDFARSFRAAKVEGLQWTNPGVQYGYRLKSSTPGFWTTTLGPDQFAASLDPRRTEY